MNSRRAAPAGDTDGLICTVGAATAVAQAAQRKASDSSKRIFIAMAPNPTALPRR